MKIAKLIQLISLPLLIQSCSFDVTDTQNIDINHYLDNDKNIKLAEDLMHYDPRYIASKIAVFNESTSKGMRLGYFIRSSDRKPSYKITYSLKVKSVSDNLSELKESFEKYIPKLAKIHASKESLFTRLEPLGANWVYSFFENTPNVVLNNSSTILKDIATPKMLSDMSVKLKDEYGIIEKLEFVRAQYYEAFSEFPETVGLYYIAKQSKQKSLGIKINLHQQNNKWLVYGFFIDPVKA